MPVHSKITSSSPMSYEIRVQGVVPDSLQDYIRGLTIERRQDASGDAESILRGKCQDQAALHGVLDTLLSYGFAVMSMDVTAS